MSATFLLRLVCCLLLLCAGAVQAAPAFRLQDFADALESHPDYALAGAERELAESQLERERASGGLRLYGDAGAANVYEPQFGGGSRDYYSLLGSLGLRYPLLGTAGEQRLRVGYAGIDALLSRVQREALRQRLLQDLRSSYYGYARAEAQQALARHFLAAAPQIRAALAQRQQAGLLLEGEARELALSLTQAERQQASAAAELLRFGRELRRWRTDFAGQLVAGPGGGLDLPAEQTSDQALLALQTLQDELARAGSSPLRANAYVAGNLRRDDDLGRASSINAGISFELPLDAAGVARSTRRESAARVQRARLLLQQQRDEAARWREAMLNEQADAQAELRLAAAAAAASGSRVRETGQRAQLKAGVAGDPIERWVAARSAHFTALNALIAAQARAWAAGDDSPLTAQGCLLPAAAWLSWEALRQPPAEACPNLLVVQPARRAVYAWGGLQALEGEAVRRALGELLVSEVWLSFSPADLQQLTAAGPRQRLAAQIRAQQRAGRRVSLLLGDPDWLRAGRGETLLAIVRNLAELPFDGLQLDLEPDQLSPAERSGPGEAQAWRELARRVAELRAISPLPIGLSIHWRALVADAGGLCAACRAAASADDVVVMLYSTSAASARERIQRIAANLPGKALWLAQSIEPELAPDESHFRAGQSALRKHLEGLQSLAEQGVVAGFAVQSLETYLKASP
ncbi:TolC family protein [Uliginosibacterium sp. TH139]|uniref:TolC family protein n=1 Tax=Uliginosibacterium sp. TH139 TaxID=2067453 RepID=UPI001304463D|nr:TolC family protein [Uliginosibacterium sp. TH139]